MWSPFGGYKKGQNAKREDGNEGFQQQHNNPSYGGFQQPGIWSPTNRDHDRGIGSLYDSNIRPAPEPVLSTLTGMQQPPPPQPQQPQPRMTSQIAMSHRTPMPPPSWNPHAVKCVFLPCPRNGGRFPQDGPKEIVLQPYPRTKMELELFFMKNQMFYSEGENRQTKLTLQFFIVHKSKPVITFRKSEGMQPWKQTNKLCENWISDERFKRFYGPVVLLKLENSASFSSSENQDNVPLVLKDYTLKDYEDHLAMNAMKKNPMTQQNFLGPGYGFEDRRRGLGQTRRRMSSRDHKQGRGGPGVGGGARGFRDRGNQREQYPSLVRDPTPPPQEQAPVPPGSHRQPLLPPENEIPLPSGGKEVIVDREKLIEFCEKEVLVKTTPQRWTGLYLMNRKIPHLMLVDYCEIVIKTSMKYARYQELREGIYAINSGLKQKIGMEDMFFEFDADKKECLSLELYAKLSTKYPVGQAPLLSKPYVFDDVPISEKTEVIPRPDGQSGGFQTNVQIVEHLGTNQSVNAYEQFEHLGLVKLYKKFSRLFPHSFSLLGRFEHFCLFSGYERDFVKKLTEESRHYVVQCANVKLPDDFKPAEPKKKTLLDKVNEVFAEGYEGDEEKEEVMMVAENRGGKHYLVPLNFYDDKNFCNLVVEFRNKGLYYLGANLMSYDTALLKARLLKRQQSMGWMESIETKLFEVLVVKTKIEEEEDGEKRVVLEEQDDDRNINETLLESLTQKIFEYKEEESKEKKKKKDEDEVNLERVFTTLYWREKEYLDDRVQTPSFGGKKYSLEVLLRKTVYKNERDGVTFEFNLPNKQLEVVEKRLKGVLNIDEKKPVAPYPKPQPAPAGCVLYEGKGHTFEIKNYQAEKVAFSAFDFTLFRRFDLKRKQ